jgi:2-keto-4-pentenoate hydratase/2-oxohepta-3-ene-1,7-dioic acid hydratase in catechol pathway
MRLVTYDRGGARRLGAWVDGTVVDLPDAVGHPSFPATMERLVEHAGGTILDAGREILSHHDILEEFAVPRARLLIPLLPHALRGIEGPVVPPLVDPTTGLVVLGPDEELPWPAKGSMDMAIEVACIIAGGGDNLSRQEAGEAIFGYTIVTDWRAVSAPRRQSKSDRKANASNGRGATSEDYVAISLGPCIVTADEFDYPQAAVNVRIDGKTRSRGRIVDARGSFTEAVRQASREQALRAGDLLGSGASRGDRTHWQLHPGAVVEVEAERIGVLRTIVGASVPSLAHRR